MTSHPLSAGGMTARASPVSKRMLSGVSQAVDDLLDTFDTGHRTQLRFDLLKTFAIQHTAQFG